MSQADGVHALHAAEGRGEPLLRVLRLARPLRGRLLLSVLAGAAATGCGVALLAVSAFLLARAAQHPSIVAISVAVIAVRWLSVGRGAFRYVERLASHDVAFRVLADVRVAIYRRLELLAPAGLAAFRSGDLLARLTDEPTAHLDPQTRSALTADLLTVTAGRATLLITHEPDGLDQVDEIVVLDRGRVAQRGTHRELAAADGPYRRLQRSRTARAGR